MAHKILLVEDEAILALSEVKMIEKHGFVVEQVYTGEKAVERALGDPEISLILMDIDLGAGIDGTEAAKTILESRDIPIIFLTSHSEKEYVDRVKKITGYGYVLKNSGEFILIESIHMAYKLFAAKQDAQINLKKSEIAYQEMEAREYRLQHLNRVLLSIRNVNQVITQERDEFKLLNKACRLLVETSGYHRVWIVLTKNGIPTEPFYHAGFDAAFQPMEKLLREGGIPDCAQQAIETGEVQIERDPSIECPGCPFNEFFNGQGCGYADKATMTMALEYDRHHYGWISVILPAFYSENPDESTLFQEISGDLAFALHHIQIEQERGTLEHDLNLSRSTLMAALNNSHAGIAIADAPDGKLRYVNDAGLLIRGGDRNEIVNGIGIDQYVASWRILDFDGRPLDTDEVPLTRAVRYGETNSRQFIVRRDNQEDRVVMANAAPIRGETGEVAAGIVVFLDITENTQTEYKLQESEQRFHQLFSSMKEGVAIYKAVDNGKNFEFVDINAAGLRLGNKRKADVIGRPVTEIFPGIEQMGLLNVLRRVYQTRQPQQYPLVHYRDEQVEQWVENYVFTLPSGLVVAIYDDVSEERRTEDQLRFQAQILEALDEAVIATDVEGEVLYLNSYAEWLYGWPREEAIGMNIMNVTVPEASQQQGREIMEALKRGKSWDGDFVVHTKDGQEFLAHVTNAPVYSSEGDFIGIIGASYDVSAQRKTEREKDYLMSELNHRVKNNLALISSLVHLKDFELGDAADLADLIGQLKAVEIVHEKLNQTKDITQIDLRDYLSELLHSLFSSLTNLPVIVECRMEKTMIETKTAGAIGLIINELATNAIKHGFNSKEDPCFTIEMRKEQPGQKYVLTVSNTGNPFPEHVDIQNPTTLGLQLISTLIDQIEGTLELTRRPTPQYRIKFSCESDYKKCNKY